MAVGLPLKTTYADGDVYSASDVNDTNGTVNLVGQSLNFYAGKNKIINGDFGIWQRGTSFANPTNGAYTADRYLVAYDGSGSTRTISQQAFTLGTAPVAGYEGTYFFRWAQTVAGTATINQVIQKIEDVRTFAGQTVTLSFWAKAGASKTINVYLGQRFGTGGSAYVGAIADTASLTTSWQRFSFTAAVPSIAGKTVGASSFLELLLDLSTSTFTVDIWGVQVEAGSTATAFETATGTIQGELAACQRYYLRSATGSNVPIGYGSYLSASLYEASVFFPVEMRTSPTIDQLTGTNYYITNVLSDAFNSLTIDATSTKHAIVYNNTQASGTTGYGLSTWVKTNDANAYLGFSAEL